MRTRTHEPLLSWLPPALGWLTLAAVFALCAALGGCGDNLAAESDNVPGGGDTSSDTGGGGFADVGPTPDATEDTFIPEEEQDFRLQPPAASRNFVFVANTDLNSVAKIDSVTLTITTIEVGFEPTIVRTIPDTDRAVVLNEGSSDVSIVYADEGDRVETVPVIEGANSLVLSPTGEFAIAYYDDAAIEPGGAAGSLSDATRIDLRDGLVTTNLVVGFHIREIEFDSTGNTAYFITDDGVAVVDLPAAERDAFVPPVRVSLDPLEDATAVDREVEIAADGDYALVRTSVETTLRLVDLSNGAISTLDLGAVPTDLDLLPGGIEAVVVLRETSRVMSIPIPGAFERPATAFVINLMPEVVGLAEPIPGGRRFALFSTLNENDHLTILDLDGPAIETYALRKGIEAVYPSPDGTRLLVFHTKLPGDPVPGTATFIAQSFGFSVFNLETRTARLVLTEARPGDFVFAEGANSAFIVLADETRGVNAVVWANLATGRDETIELRREPQAIGLIPATGRVFVSQEHEVGRMAFIDPETGEVREVTGYHLNSRTE